MHVFDLAMKDEGTSRQTTITTVEYSLLNNFYLILWLHICPPHESLGL